MNNVFSNIKPLFLKDLILVQFLLILTYKDTDEEDKLSLLNATLQLGRKVVKRYLFQVIVDVYKSNNKEDKGLKYFKYDKALKQWIDNDKNIKIYESLKDDTFVSKLGGKLIDVLEFSDMLVKELVINSKTDKYWRLDVVKDDKLNSLGNKNIIKAIPSKLPMICKPLDYTRDSLGGFLLNDKKYTDHMFI